MKVMIVDDHAGVRKMMMSYLSDVADEFVECSNGSEALAAYEMHRPDVVLMDIEMKSMDGLTATKNIKRDFPAAVIVIVSQYESARLREDARAAGARDYFNKTCLSPLHDFLDRGRSERGL